MYRSAEMRVEHKEEGWSGAELDLNQDLVKRQSEQSSGDVLNSNSAQQMGSSCNVVSYGATISMKRRERQL